MFQKINGQGTAKNGKQEENRTRKVIQNFRLTEDEKKYIFKRIELSGLSKQEYFLQSLMFQQVICIANVKTFDRMRNQLICIENHIEKLIEGGTYDEEIFQTLRMILELFNGLETKDFQSIRDKSSAPIVSGSGTSKYKNGSVRKREIKEQQRHN